MKNIFDHLRHRRTYRSRWGQLTVSMTQPRAGLLIFDPCADETSRRKVRRGLALTGLRHEEHAWLFAAAVFLLVGLTTGNVFLGLAACLVGWLAVPIGGALVARGRFWPLTGSPAVYLPVSLEGGYIRGNIGAILDQLAELDTHDPDHPDYRMMWQQIHTSGVQHLEADQTPSQPRHPSTRTK